MKFSHASREGFLSIWRVLNSFANESISFNAKQTPYRCSAYAKDPYLLQTGELKDFNQGKSTIERLMKRHQTKEEEPERSETKEGPTGDFEVRSACFVSRACILVKEDRDRGRT